MQTRHCTARPCAVRASLCPCRAGHERWLQAPLLDRFESPHVEKCNVCSVSFIRKLTFGGVTMPCCSTGYIVQCC